MIVFCIVSTDLISDVLNVRVKRGAELSTDHHLVVCSLRISKPVPSRKLMPRLHLAVLTTRNET